MTSKWILDDVACSEKSWEAAHSTFPEIIAKHINSPKIGVEIGVAYGSMTLCLLKKFDSLFIYPIDPYVPYDPKDQMSRDVNRQNEIYQYTNERLSLQFPNRQKLLRQKSTEAISQFDDNSLDFVFIDACHQYKSVKEDIDCWYHKVKLGGVFAGHDYIPYKPGKSKSFGWPGVKKAVDEFSKKKNKKITTTSAPSFIWFTIK